MRKNAEKIDVNFRRTGTLKTKSAFRNEFTVLFLPSVIKIPRDTATVRHPTHRSSFNGKAIIHESYNVEL